MKIKESLTNFSDRVLNTFGCVAPLGIAYKIYHKIAGSLYCMCCVFWRGFALGLLATLACWGLVWLLTSVLS